MLETPQSAKPIQFVVYRSLRRASFVACGIFTFLLCFTTLVALSFRTVYPASFFYTLLVGAVLSLTPVFSKLVVSFEPDGTVVRFRQWLWGKSQQQVFPHEEIEGIELLPTVQDRVNLSLRLAHSNRRLLLTKYGTWGDVDHALSASEASGLPFIFPGDYAFGGAFQKKRLDRVKNVGIPTPLALTSLPRIIRFSRPVMLMTFILPWQMFCLLFTNHHTDDPLTLYYLLIYCLLLVLLLVIRPGIGYDRVRRCFLQFPTIFDWNSKTIPFETIQKVIISDSFGTEPRFSARLIVGENKMGRTLFQTGGSKELHKLFAIIEDSGIAVEYKESTRLPDLYRQKLVGMPLIENMSGSSAS